MNASFDIQNDGLRPDQFTPRATRGTPRFGFLYFEWAGGTRRNRTSHLLGARLLIGTIDPGREPAFEVDVRPIRRLLSKRRGGKVSYRRAVGMASMSAVSSADPSPVDRSTARIQVR